MPAMPYYPDTLHWFHFQVTTCRYALWFHRLYKAEHVKQAIKEMLNTCETDKQCVHIILRDNVRNMKKAMDDMEVPSVGCVSHTLQLAVQKGPLAQSSVTDSPGNERKVVGQCCNNNKNIIKGLGSGSRWKKIWSLLCAAMTNKNDKDHRCNPGSFLH